MTTPLPEFETPPVIEVVLGVQFERLESLHAPQLGHVWQAFRDRFPKTEEHPPLEPAFEQFGQKHLNQTGVRLEMLSAFPPPRIWFLNEAGTELVQIQQDRFVRNWRKRSEGNPYPRYAFLRGEFANDFRQFVDIASPLGFGPVQANQCEITYVNIIAAGEGWTAPGELAEVFTQFRSEYSDQGMGLPEEAAVNSRYVIKDGDTPIGRLHVAIAPVVRESDGTSAFRFSLTARGIPRDESLEGVLAFLDQGHEVIVRSFASLTTPKMHQIWGRTQ